MENGIVLKLHGTKDGDVGSSVGLIERKISHTIVELLLLNPIKTGINIHGPQGKNRIYFWFDCNMCSGLNLSVLKLLTAF